LTAYFWSICCEIKNKLILR